MKNYLKICLFILLTVCALNLVRGQNDQNSITISKQSATFGMNPIPVSLEGFSGVVAEVLRFDLYVQGFSFVSPDAAQYQISGSNSGNVVGGVSDKFAKSTLLSRSYSGADLRGQAHAFANDIVQAITGKPGISLRRGATARIAFKAQPRGYGPGEIYVSDFDGGNARAVTHDGAIVAAPAWVPGRLALCYTSYKLANPDIFFHDLSTGQRRLLAGFSGLNTSAAVSPDGAKVAMVLSKSGSDNLWVCNLDGSDFKRITSGIEDSSPCWSPDGQRICFATKIRGRRLLAKVPADGGEVRVIHTAGAPNPSEPEWSPDGKWITFTSQTSEFDVCVVPADGGADPVVLVRGQDPSWAPNSRTLIFDRSVSHRQRLSVLDVFTKQYKDIDRIAGSDSEPAWEK
jgi:TolB protein